MVVRGEERRHSPFSFSFCLKQAGSNRDLRMYLRNHCCSYSRGGTFPVIGGNHQCPWTMLFIPTLLQIKTCYSVEIGMKYWAQSVVASFPLPQLKWNSMETFSCRLSPSSIVEKRWGRSGWISAVATVPLLQPVPKGELSVDSPCSSLQEPGRIPGEKNLKDGGKFLKFVVPKSSHSPTSLHSAFIISLKCLV